MKYEFELLEAVPAGSYDLCGEFYRDKQYGLIYWMPGTGDCVDVCSYRLRNDVLSRRSTPFVVGSNGNTYTHDLHFRYNSIEFVIPNGIPNGLIEKDVAEDYVQLLKASVFGQFLPEGFGYPWYAFWGHTQDFNKVTFLATLSVVRFMWEHTPIAEGALQYWHDGHTPLQSILLANDDECSAMEAYGHGLVDSISKDTILATSDRFWEDRLLSGSFDYLFDVFSLKSPDECCHDYTAIDDENEEEDY